MTERSIQVRLLFEVQNKQKNKIMCWESKKLKIKTAKKDIPVWKVVYADKDINGRYTNKCHSFYKFFEYILKVRNTTQMSFGVLNTKNTFVGNNGFHSYSNKVKYTINEINISVYLNKLFSDYIICYYYRGNTTIAKCHIPKGSKYAINEYSEIISNNIVLDEFVEIK